MSSTAVADIKEISHNLFESVVLAINNRVQIMDKLPVLKDKLNDIAEQENDSATKLAIDLLDELRGIQSIKWGKDGYGSFDTFASHDKGVRSIFGKNFNSWNKFLDATRDKFTHILDASFINKFRISGTEALPDIFLKSPPKAKAA